MQQFVCLKQQVEDTHGMKTTGIHLAALTLLNLRYCAIFPLLGLSYILLQLFMLCCCDYWAYVDPNTYYLALGIVKCFFLGPVSLLP